MEDFDKQRIVKKEQLKNEEPIVTKKRKNSYKVSNPEQEILTEDDWNNVTTTLFNDSTKRN